ncbi:hypothetical protein L596_022004 [Steinernema carpocapsae]|uniref:Uncharacterized protein n=1 Tax=Steinernema carpocapsae TaxID=34508 RepID=A0A4U5ML98_STECR|nr:hypothetical protein L596_022004 [Steinernema carpocapsae]
MLHETVPTNIVGSKSEMAFEKFVILTRGTLLAVILYSRVAQKKDRPDRETGACLEIAERPVGFALFVNKTDRSFLATAGNDSAPRLPDMPPSPCLV